MNCCDELPEYLEASNQSSPFNKMEQIHCYEQFWCNLKKCNHCQQLWIVDEWDKYQIMVSIKVTKIPADEEIKDLIEKYHERVTIEKHGGYSDEKCVWSGCKNRAIKDMKICYRHFK